MIHNDHELEVMKEGLAKTERVLEALRKTARPEEWPALSSGYPAILSLKIVFPAALRKTTGDS